MSSSPTFPKSSMEPRKTSCFGSSCRRRTITGKILPAMLQIFIVVCVYHVIISAIESSDSTSGPRILRSAERSNCSCEIGSTGHLLKLETILSPAKASSSNKAQTRYLNVEIIVRDVEYGSVILYPVGASVIFSDIKATGDSDLNYVEYNADADEDEEEVEDEGTDDGDYTDNIEESEDDNVDEMTDENDEDNGNEEEDEEEQFQIGMYDNDNDMENNQMEGQQMQQGMPHVQYDQFGRPIRSNNMVVQMNQNQQIQQTGQGWGNAGQSPFGQQMQERDARPHDMAGTSYQGRQSSYMGQQQDRAGEREQPTGNLEYKQVIFGGRPLSGSVQADGIDSLHEGYRDRVKKFKFELFGRIMEDEVGDEPVANVYYLNNPHVCADRETIDLLYLIHSIPQSGETRRRIRETFANPSLFEPEFSVAHVFLVGKTNSPNFQSNLNQEDEAFGDIVQGVFMDHTENVTLKGLMGMRWVKEFCKKAKFVMKVEEDIFVDTSKLLKGLIPAVEKVVGNRAMLCVFNPETPVPRSGPRAIRRDLFPNRPTLRPYCQGFSVLMTQDVIPSMLAASKHVPVFNVTDLYLFGVLPFVAGGIEVYDLGNKRAFHDFGVEVLDCYKEKGDACPFVVSVAFSSRFSSLWDLVKTRSHDGWNGDSSLWDVASFKMNF